MAASTSASKRQMRLGVFVLGTGNHSAGWRYEGAMTSSCSLPVMQSIAQIAERGKFDLFFISDGLAMDPGDHPSFISRFEPMTLLAAISMVTRHIGLGATVSTSFSEPFQVARAFASLDHLSGGRAGWNVVTSTHNAAALNFSRERLHEHDLRYEIATEFVDVVRGLWDTWEDGAVVADKATGTFLDKSKVRPLDHKGRFFTGQRAAQHPALPAGPSDHHPGRRLAARAGAFGALGRPGVLGGQWRCGLGQGRLRQLEATSDQAWTLARARSHPAGRDADHRRDRRAGQGAAGALAKLADAHQRARAGVAAIGARHLGLSARRSGPRVPADRPRSGLLEDVVRDGSARENDLARSLQCHGCRARPLGALRHAQTDRGCVPGMVRGWNGGRLRRHAGVLPGRVRRLRQSGGARAAAARPVPDRVLGHDAARPPGAATPRQTESRPCKRA